MRPTTLGLLRAAYVVLAALLAPVLLVRLGVPPAWLPDLVLIGVVATAALRGPVHGALAGLVSGWVVSLVPPVGEPFGLGALVMALAGLGAGLARRSSLRSPFRIALALLVAVGAVLLLETASAVVTRQGWNPGDAAPRLASTLVVGALVLPGLVGADRALVRRRLG